MQAYQSHTQTRFNYKIAEGTLRDVYASGDNAFKVIKPSLYNTSNNKVVCLIKHVLFYFKMLVWDINSYEFKYFNQFIEKIPYTIRNSFSTISGVKKIEGKTVSVSKLVKNSDGTAAVTLGKHGVVKQASFWNRLDKLEEALIQNKIYLLGLSEDNIVVQYLADGSVIPVCIDFKRYGGHTYPMQVWLMRNTECVKKMQRQFARLRQKYHRPA